MKKNTLCRFYKSMGEMLGSGVPLAVALEKIEQDDSFEDLCDFARYVKVSVRLGESFSECFRKAGFPDDQVEIIQAAGNRGDLDEQFLHLAGMARKARSFKLKLPDVDLSPEEKAIKLINQWVSFAVENRASDLHIVPTLKEIAVKFRIDGVLHPYEVYDKTLLPLISARLKTMSMLDLMEKKLPQDGRIMVRVKDTECDIRLSVVPTVTGEKWTARFLIKNQIILELSRLGLNDDQQKSLKQIMDRPYGLVLVTGGCGSGKTTTCYSMLKEYASHNLNITTVEDPVEYLLEGATQIQTNPSIGLTFPAAIRTLFRTDPDIMFIGETRAHETLDLAIKAAQTGHIVLCQFHSKTTLEMLEMFCTFNDIDHPVLANVLNGIIAQVLLRKLCECRKKAAAPPSVKKIYGIKTVFEPVGCEKCLHSGYRGRWPAYEVIQPGLKLKEELASRDAEGIRLQLMKDSGRENIMLANAMKLVAEGITSMSEIYRVFGSA